MDVVVNRNNGADPGDIHVAIENAEGLEISRGSYKGYPSGTRISDGTAYVRIAPGEVLCLEIQVLVPESLDEGDVIRFNGIVDTYSFDFSGSGLQGSEPLTGFMNSGITLSAYYGTAQADKNIYADDESVIITGQAIDRETGLPETNAPLKLGFHLRGFTWYQNVTTDGSGNYSHEYAPPLGISGEFMIWGAHPDVFDTIDQDRFSFYRMYASPSDATIRSSKADTLDFEISLINPGDLELTDFSLEFSAHTVDEFGSQIPETRIQGQAVFPDFPPMGMLGHSAPAGNS